MDIKTAFINPALANEGAWVTLPETPFEFRIIYTQADKPRKWYANALQAARKLGRRGEIPGEKLDSIILEMLIRFIVIDWKGLMSNGSEFPFTPENLRLVLTDSLAIRDFIFNQASDEKTFGAFNDGGTAAKAELKSGAAVESGMGPAPSVA